MSKLCVIIGTTKRLQFYIVISLLAELYQCKQRGLLIMNHRDYLLVISSVSVSVVDVLCSGTESVV